MAITRRLACTAVLTVPVLALGGAAAANGCQGNHHHGHHHGHPGQHGPDYSWKVTPTGSDDQFRGLAAVSSRVAWVSGEVGTVLKTTDGGKTWQDVSPTGTGLELRDIEAWDSRHAITLSIG